MGIFVDHARHELALLGEEPETIEWYVSVLEAFAAFGHSGGSYYATLPVLYDLLQLKPLVPLTYGPEEWFKHEGQGPNGGDLWQNKRDSRIFSVDGGKTHYNVEEK